MFEQRRATGEGVDPQALCFEFRLKFPVVSPVLHGPDRTGHWGDGDITPKIGFNRGRQNIFLPFEPKTQSVEDQFLIRLAVQILQFIRALPAMNTDQAEVEPAARVVRVGNLAIAVQMGTCAATP